MSHLSLLLVDFGLGSAHADARVDEWGDEIGQKVAKNDGAGRNQSDAHDDRDIDALNGLPGKLADTRPAKDAFYQDDDQENPRRRAPTLASCWAHARRKSKEVFDRDGSEIAAEGLRRIAESTGSMPKSAAPRQVNVSRPARPAPNRWRTTLASGSKARAAAYAEALASLTPEMVEFYNMDTDDLILALSIEFDTLSFIDSPLQNLALLRDALDGSVALPGVTNDIDTLMAIFLGVASDKTLPITSETVVAVTTILGEPITGAAAEELAAEAEAIRIAVLAGHG